MPTAETLYQTIHLSTQTTTSHTKTSQTTINSLLNKLVLVNFDVEVGEFVDTEPIVEFLNQQNQDQ